MRRSMSFQNGTLATLRGEMPTAEPDALREPHGRGPAKTLVSCFVAEQHHDVRISNPTPDRHRTVANAHPAESASMDQTSSNRPVALVVEDDAAIRNLATAVLEETDLDVIACSSAEAAIATLERGDVRVALLFADIRLGGAMDGVALAATVEKRWPEVRVVVTSGYGAREATQLSSQVVYLRKPWRVLDVLVQAEHATLAAKAA